MAEHQLAAPNPSQSLPPELRRIAESLCDTYDALDLRIETTLAAAADDFIAALPEMKGREAELRQFVALLTDDLRMKAGGAHSRPVLLRLSFQSENDLLRQLSLKTEGVQA